MNCSVAPRGGAISSWASRSIVAPERCARKRRLCWNKRWRAIAMPRPRWRSRTTGSTMLAMAALNLAEALAKTGNLERAKSLAESVIADWEAMLRPNNLRIGRAKDRIWQKFGSCWPPCSIRRNRMRPRAVNPCFDPRRRHIEQPRITRTGSRSMDKEALAKLESRCCAARRQRKRKRKRSS